MVASSWCSRTLCSMSLQRVLAVKLGFESRRVEELRAFLVDLAGARVGVPVERPPAIAGDPDDDVVLACALAADVQILVSGDRRHLLPVGEHRGVRIISPQALLAELANE